MSEWGCCQSNTNCEEKINCNKCKKLFHIDCLQARNIDSDDYSLTDWSCPLCKSIGVKSKRNDNTPVRASGCKPVGNNTNVTVRSSKRPALSSPPTSSTPATLTPDDVKHIIRSEFADMLSIMKNTLSEFTNELKSIKGDISDMKESMDFMNHKFESVLKEVGITSESVKILKSENESMKNTINRLNERVNQMEQQSRASNIEIQCIPERKNENIIAMIKQLGIVIGYQVTNEKIMHCTRTAKINKSNERPRSIVVQFNTPYIRDSFLAAAFKYNKSHRDDKLNSGHLGIQGDKKPIYVMEHLSPTNKSLHAAARAKAKEIGYKYVWVRNGRVFMRKDDASEYKHVRDSASLENFS